MSKPKLIYCLLCEDVRQEAGGKISILGLLGSPPYATLGVSELDKPLSKLVCVFGLTEVELGHHEFTVTLQSPNGEIITQEMPIIANPKKPVIVIGAVFERISVTTPGDFHLKLVEGDIEIQNTHFSVNLTTPKTVAI